MLAVQDLTFVPVGKSQALLQGIALTHAQGTLGIIGPNGAGKSTLIKLLSGFESPSQGRVLWLGRALQDCPDAVRAQQIAVVSPREAQPAFGLKVWEYLRFGRAPYQRWHGGWSRRDAEVQAEIVALTELESLLAQPLRELSSGEWQRVQLSRALMQEPRLLLLDEPTSHLDVGAQIRLLKALKTFRQDLLMIVVLHDLNLAAQYMDQLLLLHQGQVFCQGSPEEVLTPENLAQVYGERWQVSRHESTQRPVVLPEF